MSFLFSKRAHVADADEVFIGGTGIFASNTGGSISEQKVLGIAAAWAATRVIAESVSMLPFHTFQRVENGKERAPAHPTDRILSLRPNPEITAVEFWDALIGQAVLRGNSFANVERNSAGRVVGLWPLRSDKMRLERANGTLVYVYMLNDRQFVLPVSDVLHIKGFGLDGFAGLDPLKIQRDTYGSAIAADEQATRFYNNDASPGGILAHPGRLSNDARKNMADSWAQAHGGFKNKHRVAVLEEGVTWTAVGLDPERSQMLQTREFHVTEIARVFRVPPHMIADLTRATFSNVEQMSQDFLTHSLMPWLVRIEQAVNTTLFTEREQQTLFAEHQVQGLLRADAAARSAFYGDAINAGWMSPDEVRSLENMNPQPDGVGQVYQRPLNVVYVGPGAGSTPKPEPEPADRSFEARKIERRNASTRLELQLANRSAFENVLREIITRERADILKIAKRNLEQRNAQDFKRELSEFYAGHRKFITRKFKPLLRSLAESIHVATAAELDKTAHFGAPMQRFVDEYAETYEQRHVKSGEGQIVAIVDSAEPDEMLEVIEGRLDEWGEKRHEKIAGREVVQMGNAAAWASFAFFGVQAWRWVTVGKDCPICEQLDGRIVNAGGNFFHQGDSVGAPGVTPVKVRTDIAHPPLHQGCDCQLVPV